MTMHRGCAMYCDDWPDRCRGVSADKPVTGCINQADDTDYNSAMIVDHELLEPDRGPGSETRGRTGGVATPKRPTGSGRSCIPRQDARDGARRSPSAKRAPVSASTALATVTAVFAASFCLAYGQTVEKQNHDSVSEPIPAQASEDHPEDRSNDHKELNARGHIIGGGGDEARRSVNGRFRDRSSLSNTPSRQLHHDKTGAGYRHGPGAKSKVIARNTDHERTTYAPATMPDLLPEAEPGLPVGGALAVMANLREAARMRQFPRGGNVRQSARPGGVRSTNSIAERERRRTITRRLRVTAYCPCRKCCGSFANGWTASGHPVSFNGSRFAAAPRWIPFGAVLTIPGYNGGRAVPVLDRGGAIKGDRLDVFFPTHNAAPKWGVRYLDVEITASDR